MEGQRGHRRDGDTRQRGRVLAEQVIREHHALVLAVARRYGGAAHADDIAARVYEKIVQGRAPDEGRPLLPWLRSVVRNQAIDHLRCLRTHEPIDGTEIAVGHDLAQRVADRLVVADALARLTAAERDAVTADLLGRTPAEVAASHGRTTHAVHSLATRARKQLRALLEPAMLPGLAALAWFRRTAHRLDQPVTTYAMDAALAVALLLSVPSLSTDVFVVEPPSVRRLEQAALAQGRVEFVGSKAPSTHVPGGRSKPAKSPAGSARPRGLEIDVDQREGATAPRGIVIRQPEIATPVGTSSGETWLDCVPGGRLPDTPFVSNFC